MYSYLHVIALAYCRRNYRAKAILSSNMAAPNPQLHPLLRHGILAVIFLFAFWIRILVSLHPYSGAGTPPRFGDYEAQRHWMEITLNLPIKDWYTNTTDNDLQYWGLDYPPLTAYQSLLHGLALHSLEPESVALHKSRGYETPSSKLLMRWTVLSSDAFVFFPAALCFVAAYYAGRRFGEVAWALTMILLQPALILIDHGHFQYNCISLGLTVGAVAAICSRKDVLASILFCLALNHKQMSAYFAPAFFAHLLGKCLRQQRPFLEVMKLGMVVIGTFVACWWPYLHSRQAAFMVLSRLAPLQRGIFEDYVANFWCGTSLIIKWKQIYSTVALARLALMATIIASLPSVVQQIKAPSRQGFVLAMFNISLSFYLFSYQVHEKSILLPLLPASLFVLEDPLLYMGMVSCAMFSMFPLLRRDGLVVPYVALFALHYLLFYSSIFGIKFSITEGKDSRFPISSLTKASFLIGSILNLGYMLLEPPVRYPYIFEAVITAFVFLHLLLLGIYTNLKQWSVPSDDGNVVDKEKLQ